MGNKPVLAWNKNAFGNTSWVGTEIVTNSSGTFLYEEGEEKWTENAWFGLSHYSNRLLNVTEINRDWVYFNLANNGSFFSQVRNGELQICPAGCADCNCTTCIAGFGKNNDTGHCVKCPPGCNNCNGSNTTDCMYGCFSGYTYNSTTKECDSCSLDCLTCSYYTTSCTSCLPGEFRIYNYTTYEYACFPVNVSNCLKFDWRGRC